MIKEINYYILLNLLKVFNSLHELYFYSNNKEYFTQILIQNNFNLSDKLINSLTDKELKNKSKKVYLNLLSKKFAIISIFSKFYPKELKDNINAPFALVIYGNIRLLFSNKKKVYLYNEEKGDRRFSILEEEIIKNRNVILVNQNCSYSIDVISCENLFNENFEIYNLDNKKLYILVHNESIITEIVSAISGVLFVIRASFNKHIFKISSSMLEYGKDILVVPGEIYTEKTYFSNYLLREGAIIILNRKDIKYYFDKF